MATISSNYTYETPVAVNSFISIDIVMSICLLIYLGLFIFTIYMTKVFLCTSYNYRDWHLSGFYVCIYALVLTRFINYGLYLGGAGA